MRTFGADDVCRHGCTAFGTICPLDGRFVIVSAAGAGSGVAVFSFGDCHKGPRFWSKLNETANIIPNFSG